MAANSGTGSTMVADIGLLIGLAGGESLDEGSGKLINGQINKIIRKINSDQKANPKLKLSIDPAVLQKSIEDGIKKAKNLNVDVKTKVTVDVTDLNAKVDEAIKKLQNVKINWNAPPDSITKTGKNSNSQRTGGGGGGAKRGSSGGEDDNAKEFNYLLNELRKVTLKRDELSAQRPLSGTKSEKFDTTTRGLSEIRAEIKSLENRIQKTDTFKNEGMTLQEVRAMAEYEPNVIKRVTDAINISGTNDQAYTKRLSELIATTARMRSIEAANVKLSNEDKSFRNVGLISQNKEIYDQLNDKRNRLMDEIKETEGFRRSYAEYKAQYGNRSKNRFLNDEINSDRTVKEAVGKIRKSTNDAFNDHAKKIQAYMKEISNIDKKNLKLDGSYEEYELGQRRKKDLWREIRTHKDAMIEIDRGRNRKSGRKLTSLNREGVDKYIASLSKGKREVYDFNKAHITLKKTIDDLFDKKYDYIKMPEANTPAYDKAYSDRVYEANQRRLALQKEIRDLSTEKYTGRSILVNGVWEKHPKVDFNDISVENIRKHQKAFDEYFGLLHQLRDAKIDLDNALKDDRAIKKYANKIGDFLHQAEKTASPEYLKKVRELFNQAKTGNFEGGINGLIEQFVHLQNVGIEAGEIYETIGQKISRVFKDKFGYALMAVAANEVRKVLSETYTNVLDIDAAMTELKKVTNETAETYNHFLDGAADRARDLGSSLADTVRATADFARLGYSLGEASDLADASLVYKNVGDGIENIDEAAESLISTMKAFESGVDDPMLIIDKFNKVGRLSCPAA